MSHRELRGLLVPGLIAAVRAHAADGHAGGAAALLAELAALAADADAPRYERHYV